MMFGSMLLAGLLMLSPQAVDKTPMLTEAQKFQMQNAVLKVENAQLRFEAARAELMTLLQTRRVEGYDFDLSTMTYKPKAVEKPK